MKTLCYLSVLLIPLVVHAEPTNHFVSEKWFDGSWWEVDLPDGWQLKEKSAQHIRLSRNGAELLVGFRKDSPQNTRTPEQRAYDTTKWESTIVDWPLPFHSPFAKENAEKQTLGVLSGYSYLKDGWLMSPAWGGYFFSDQWLVYTHLDSSKSTLTANKDVAWRLLSSISFRHN